MEDYSKPDKYQPKEKKAYMAKKLAGEVNEYFNEKLFPDINSFIRGLNRLFREYTG